MAENNSNTEVNASRLCRVRKDQVLGGVAMGIAQYLKVDVILVRLAFVALALVTEGFGVMLYIVLWIILPLESSENEPRDRVLESNVAEIKSKAQTLANQISAPESVSNARAVFGGILIIVGLVALLNSLGINLHISFVWFWPALIITLGLILLLKK